MLICTGKSILLILTVCADLGGTTIVIVPLMCYLLMCQSPVIYASYFMENTDIVVDSDSAAM